MLFRSSKGPPHSPAPQPQISGERSLPGFLHSGVVAKIERPRSGFAIWIRAQPIECRSNLPARRALGGGARAAEYSALLLSRPLQIRFPDLSRAPTAKPEGEIEGTEVQSQIRIHSCGSWQLSRRRVSEPRGRGREFPIASDDRRKLGLRFPPQSRQLFVCIPRQPMPIKLSGVPSVRQAPKLLPK